MFKKPYIKLIVIGVAIITGLAFSKLMQWRQTKIDALVTPLDPFFSPLANYTADKTRVLLFGDSRMAQWLSSWPDGYSVINRGISGSTTFQSLARIERDVLAYRPEWVVVQMGINDVVASRLLLGKQRQQVLKRAVDNIQTTVQALRAADINVILMSVVPDINADVLRLLVWQGNLEADVAMINKALRDRNMNGAVFFDVEQIFTENDEWKTDYARDALHWNAKAYQVLLQATTAIIER